HIRLPCPECPRAACRGGGLSAGLPGAGEFAYLPALSVTRRRGAHRDAGTRRRRLIHSSMEVRLLHDQGDARPLHRAVACAAQGHLMGRIDIVAIVVSLVLLGYVIEAVRRRKLREEYSILWLVTASVILLLSLVRPALIFLAKAMGIL